MKTMLVLLLLASTALADEVVLKNGSVLSGIVREEGDHIVVEMDYGTMSFKKVDVRSVNRGEDVLSQFQSKAKAATDVKSMIELAAWAKDRGLNGRANDLYRKVIVLDPENAEARKALGYEKVSGVWLAGDDLMTARGYVKISGRWMTRDLAERILAQEAQARIESDRLDLARRVADQRHQEEMIRIGLERDTIEGPNSWWWRNPWSFAPGPFGGFGGILLPVVGPSQTLPLPPPSQMPLPSTPPARR